MVNPDTSLRKSDPSMHTPIKFQSVGSGQHSDKKSTTSLIWIHDAVYLETNMFMIDKYNRSKFLKHKILNRTARIRSQTKVKASYVEASSEKRVVNKPNRRHGNGKKSEKIIGDNNAWLSTLSVTIANMSLLFLHKS